MFPAIAVAQALQQSGAQVHWLGTLVGMENELLQHYDFTYHAINMQGLRGNGIKRLFKAPSTLLKATLAAIKIISFYAKGQTTTEIVETIKDIYDVDISSSLVSRVTDNILDDITAWQNRPLSSVYPIVYLEPVHD